MAKVIINEFLTFVQNKYDVLDKLSIIQICATNFTDAEIVEAKNLFYKECGSTLKNVVRKGDDKKKKNIGDVLSIFEEIDPENQPCFVAKDLNRLPPVTFDHVDVTRLLKDMTAIKSDLTNLQLRINQELTDIRSGLNRRDVTEANLTNSPKRTPTLESLPRVTGTLPPVSDASLTHTPTYRDMAINRSRRQRSMQVKPAPRRVDESGHNSMAALGVCPSINSPVDALTYVDTHSDNNDFKTVSYKKRRKPKMLNMRGSMLSNSRIQVAETLCHIYVSRAKKTVTVEDMQEHIRESGQNFVKVELLKAYRDTTFNSFKVTVNGSQAGTMMDAGFWPAGLVYRRFRERHVRDDNKQTHNG